MIWRGRNENPEGAEPPAGAGARGADQGGVGSRVESVLDAAERAAMGIREDAEDWARQYMEESRRKADELSAKRVEELSQLTDNLMSRARAVAKQSDDLISALDDAGRSLLTSATQGELGTSPASLEPAPSQVRTPPPASPPPVAETAPPPAEQRAPEPQAPPAAAQPTPASPPPRPAPSAPSDSRVSEGARLLATQMAVAGSTRDEIAWRLREEFAIQDSSAILDEIGL